MMRTTTNWDTKQEMTEWKTQDSSEDNMKTDKKLMDAMRRL